MNECKSICKLCKLIDSAIEFLDNKFVIGALTVLMFINVMKVAWFSYLGKPIGLADVLCVLLCGAYINMFFDKRR